MALIEKIWCVAIYIYIHVATCTSSSQITTPLLWAIERGDLESVRMLLDCGVDPDRPDRVRIAEHC